MLVLALLGVTVRLKTDAALDVTAMYQYQLLLVMELLVVTLGVCVLASRVMDRLLTYLK